MRQSFARAAVLVLVLGLPLALARAGENTWTVSGPPGGRVHGLQGSSTDPNVFYAAYSRTFFRTTDGGSTWRARPFAHEVVDIAVDPTDGTRVYVAALDDGVYRSEDGGATFTQVAPGTSQVWAVGVGGADGKTVYYATGNGSFFRSTDRGQTFVARTSTPLTITQILVASPDGLSVFAVRGPALARSSDGGQTWSESTVSSANDFIQSFTRLGSGTLVATTTAKVFTSPDGITWTQVLVGTFYGAVADPANPNGVVLANVGGARLYRNTNNGDPASWTQVGTAPPLGTPMRIIVTGDTPSHFVLANGQGIEVSTDGGTTWTDASSGLAASAPVMASTLAANAGVYAYTASDTSGLLSTTTDNGWQRLNLSGAQARVLSTPLGQATVAVKPGAPLTVYVGAFDAGLLRSDDGGTTWSGPAAGLIGFGINAIAFDPVDPNKMYASVSQGTAAPAAALYGSTDGGTSWAPLSLNLPGAYGIRLVVEPSDGTHLFLAAAQGTTTGANAGLYVSTDSGLNWSQATAIGNRTVHDLVLDPSGPNRIYAAVDGIGLTISTDGGATFAPNTALTALTTGQVVAALAIDPVVPTTIYAATADPNTLEATPLSSYILRSVDRGQTWETLRSVGDQPTWFVDQLMVDPNVPTLLYAGTGTSGIGAFEIVNDPAVSISGHSGTKPKGVASTFDVNAQNNGALSATAVHVTVQLPAGLTSVSATVPTGSCSITGNTVQCDVPVIRPAQSSAVHVTYTPPGEMTLPVSATVSAHEKDAAQANNSAQASASSGEVVDLRVTASASPSSVTVGNAFTYTVQVSNAGPDASSSATLTFAPAAGVTLGSTLPSGCSLSSGTATCTLATLAVNGSQSFAFSATGSTAGGIAATATVSAATTAVEADSSNNTSQTTVTISNAPPPSSGGGGGGGGAMDLLTLLACSGYAARAMRRRATTARTCA